MSQVTHVMTHTHRTFNICVASYHSSNTCVSLKYHSFRSLPYESPKATSNASSKYITFLFQIPASILDVRTVYFENFYYIYPINTQYMPTDDCWHILCTCWLNTVKKQFPVFSLKLFSRCIPLLPHLLVRSILSSNIPSITGEDIFHAICGQSM
jgi:hypothetical protein